jgi:hypothetical protein
LSLHVAFARQSKKLLSSLRAKPQIGGKHELPRQLHQLAITQMRADIIPVIHCVCVWIVLSLTSFAMSQYKGCIEIDFVLHVKQAILG